MNKKITRTNFHEFFENGVLLDGAIGTEIYRRGVFINKCFEEVNLTQPELIRAIHEDYLAAGARVLTTNSWGANEIKLRGHQLHDRVEELNTSAASLAKSVALDHALVGGSVGPLGILIEPLGPTSLEEAYQIFHRQIKSLIIGGAQLIMLETFTSVRELTQAINAARDLDKNIPILAFITVDANGQLPLGTPLDSVINELNQLPIDGIGLNCSVGPQLILTSIQKIQKLTTLPLAVRPNAGLPKDVDGRQIYMSTPEYFAHFAKEFFSKGIKFVGGCCGTTPEHIRAMNNSLRYAQATQVKTDAQYTANSKSPKIEIKCLDQSNISRVPFAEKSNWSKKIAAGEKVSSVELLPPQGINAADIIEKSIALKKLGIDAINIPDGPRASSRMSALITAVLIEKEAQIETVLHYTCRDRNILGMQSDLLGAHAIGLRNLLLITGDPPKMGPYPKATGVFDFDAIGLVNMVNQLCDGVDLGGRSLGTALSFSIGVGVNPIAFDLDREIKRYYWKVKAGAEWAISQPIFDDEAFFKFLDRIHKDSLDIPIIAGIWPLTSFKNALFMHNEVPGISIPKWILDRMESYSKPEDGKKAGVEIAQNILIKIKNVVQGVQISAPFGRIDLAMKVFEALN